MAYHIPPAAHKQGEKVAIAFSSSPLTICSTYRKRGLKRKTAIFHRPNLVESVMNVGKANGTEPQAGVKTQAPS